MGLIVFMLWFVWRSPTTCFACTAQPPTSCTSNLSALTVRQNDERRAWWSFLDRREEQTLKVYLGLNYVNGTVPMTGTYVLSVNDPFLDAAINPKQITFALQPAGTRGSTDTYEIAIPYDSITTSQDLRISATLMDSNGACDLPPDLETTVRINQTGPTVWPVLPRTCPLPGEQPGLIFGVRNPSNASQTYSVIARAENPFGGTTSDVFSLNGQGDTADLGQIEIGPGKTSQINLDCETFGYCLPGGENRVGLEVFPTGNSEQFDPAFAWSNVTLRHESVPCPELKDWWFLMPPLVLATILGAIGLPLLLGGGFAAYKLFYTPPPGQIITSPPDQIPPPPKRPPSINTGQDGITHGKRLSSDDNNDAKDTTRR